MDIRAIIFDLDGTIIDSAWVWKQVTGDMISARGIQLKPEELTQLDDKLCGVGLGNACSIIKNEFNFNESVTDLVEEKKGRACKLYQTGLTFIDGFTEFHTKVASYGLKTGIATSSDDKTLGYAQKQLNLKKFFGEHIYGVSCVDFQYKPDPAIYLHVAQQLGVPPEECVAIEDSPQGVSAAKNAGMFCFGINTVGMPETIAHADKIINSYSQINLERLLKKKVFEKKEVDGAEKHHHSR